MKPHKHAELIKAWADGAEIEQKYIKDDEDDFITKWHIFDDYWLNDGWEYRIKPEPKPDYEVYQRVECMLGTLRPYSVFDNQALSGRNNNIKLTFDGETGELKSAEVLK